jgi:hypothetical protein
MEPFLPQSAVLSRENHFLQKLTPGIIDPYRRCNAYELRLTRSPSRSLVRRAVPTQCFQQIDPSLSQKGFLLRPNHGPIGNRATGRETVENRVASSLVFQKNFLKLLNYLQPPISDSSPLACYSWWMSNWLAVPALGAQRPETHLAFKPLPENGYAPLAGPAPDRSRLVESN